MSGRRIYVLKCPGCGAPVADCVQRCPYCAKRTTFEALGMHGGLSKAADGGLVIGEGAHVELGRGEGEERECPFCGAQTPWSEARCAHCRAKVRIDQMFLRSLEVVAGGSLTITAGASLTIGEAVAEPALIEAARTGDVAALRARLDAGDDLDAKIEGDRQRERLLHLAVRSGSLEAVQLFVAMGATLDFRNARGHTPAEVAEREGHGAIARVLRAAARG